MKIDSIKWKDVLSEVNKEISDVSFRTWFLPLIPINLDEEKEIMSLAVTNHMNADIFKNTPNYVNVLENSIKKVFKKSYRTKVMYKTQDEIDFILAVPQKTNTAAPSIDADNPYREEYYLNPKYNFDNFIIGPNNEYAHAVSRAVAEHPSSMYNPLFIYGGSGLGKTHLMHAIGHYIMETNPSLKVLYVSSEMFTNELIQSLQDPINKNKMVNAFREKYRNVDVFLIDDIQFIENKTQTQIEFFHTFNALYESNKQIVITSDRHPKKLRELDERLTSRLNSNVLADIQPPDFETRVAILRKKAEQEKIEIDDDFLEVINLIAEKIKLNIRELESALTRVISFSKINGGKITERFAKENLPDIFSIRDFDISCETVKKAVSKKYLVKIADMESSKKTRGIAFPRQIAMYLCRELTDLSLPKIGESFGGRDHTTVLYACDKIGKEMKLHPELAEEIRELKEDIQQ